MTPATDTSKCLGCKSYEPTSLFELCKHPTSEYRSNDKQQWHTVGHMRRNGCGERAANFVSKEIA